MARKMKTMDGNHAAAIGSAGYYNFIEGRRDNLNLNAVPNLKL